MLRSSPRTMLTTPRLLLNLKSPAQSQHHQRQQHSQNTLTPSQQRDVLHPLNGPYHAQNISQHPPPNIHHPQTIQIPMLGTLQVPPPQPNPQANQGPPPQQQNPLGQPGQGQGIPPPPPQNGQDYTLSSVLHFLQTEWRRYERDRNEWEIERAEMRVSVAVHSMFALNQFNGFIRRLGIFHAFFFLVSRSLWARYVAILCYRVHGTHRPFLRHALPFSRESAVPSKTSNWTSCDASRCSNMLSAWNGQRLPPHSPRNPAHFFVLSTHLYMQFKTACSRVDDSTSVQASRNPTERKRGCTKSQRGQQREFTSE